MQKKDMLTKVVSFILSMVIALTLSQFAFNRLAWGDPEAVTSDLFSLSDKDLAFFLLSGMTERKPYSENFQNSFQPKALSFLGLWSLFHYAWLLSMDYPFHRCSLLSYLYLLLGLLMFLCYLRITNWRIQLDGKKRFQILYT